MNIVYRVDLTPAECVQLEGIIASKAGAQKRKRAQILLAASKAIPDVTIAQTLPYGLSTIYLDEEAARPRGVGGLVGGEAGSGRSADPDETGGSETDRTGMLKPARRATSLDASAAGERIRSARRASERLEGDRPSATGGERPQALAAEDVVHPQGQRRVRGPDGGRPGPVEPPDERRPVISFDETPTQLIGKARVSVPGAPGRPERTDYECRRNGTANLFVFVDAHRSWRHVKVTDQRTNLDFASCMRDLVDRHYPHAERIRVVLDNLSTHRPKNLYEALAPEEARRILRKLEFHYTPTHASSLNMVEIEVSVLVAQCLDRRIPDRATLERQIAA